VARPTAHPRRPCRGTVPTSSAATVHRTLLNLIVHFYIKLFVFIFIYKLLINAPRGHRSTQWLRRQLRDPYVRYAYCRRWASLCAAKAYTALS
jgi:hypothetical protein